MSTSTVGAASTQLSDLPDRRTRPEWHGSIVAAFREAAASYPDRDAVLSADGKLTYAQLDDRSDRLASLLIARGAEPERSVGVLLPRVTDLIVAILGILKAGAVYVPFDPEQPAQRLARIARDADVLAVVTHSDLLGSPATEGRETIALDQVDWSVVSRAVPVELHPDNLAYIIFTSGSTGQPKGVEVSHRSLTSYLNGMEQGGFFSPPGARLAWNASVAFDASVQEWVRIFRGDTVAVLTDDMRRDGEEFAEFMAEHQLVEADMTPSHAEVLIEDLAELAQSGQFLRLYVAGEAISPALWQTLERLISDGVIHAMNLYGPTETTVSVLGTHIVPGEQQHIGAPFPGVQVRIVDELLRPVSDGTPGELCIAGPYLARGYTGRPGLTAASFVPDPASSTGERMYRTGDRVVRQPDGTIRYLGRNDDQVKIRGIRVELGEIEAVLADHPGVARAVVLHRAEEGGGSLHAAIHLRSGYELKDVQGYVNRELPSWMRPSMYTVVDSIPLTVSGKADRRALSDRLTADAQ